MFSEYWLKDFSMSNMSLVSMDVKIKKTHLQRMHGWVGSQINSYNTIWLNLKSKYCPSFSLQIEVAPYLLRPPVKSSVLNLQLSVCLNIESVGKLFIILVLVSSSVKCRIKTSFHIRTLYMDLHTAGSTGIVQFLLSSIILSN